MPDDNSTIVPFGSNSPAVIAAMAIFGLTREQFKVGEDTLTHQFPEHDVQIAISEHGPNTALIAITQNGVTLDIIIRPDGAVVDSNWELLGKPDAAAFKAVQELYKHFVLHLFMM